MKEIKDYDDNCPIYDALRLISKKWVIFIIRDIFIGKKYFSEFLEEKKLSNRVLTDTLKFMIENGLIFKVLNEDDKYEYRLTQKGYNLNNILYTLLEYGLTEVNSGNLTEKQKNELLDEYKFIFEYDLLVE